MAFFCLISFLKLKQAPAPQQSSNTSDPSFLVWCLLIFRALSPGSGPLPLPLLRPWEGWKQTTVRSGSRDRKAWCSRPEHVREAKCHWGRGEGVLSPMKPFNGHFYSEKVGGGGRFKRSGWDGGGGMSSLFSSKVLATQDVLFDGWWFDRCVWISFGWILIFFEKMDSPLGKHVVDGVACSLFGYVRVQISMAGQWDTLETKTKRVLVESNTMATTVPFIFGNLHDNFVWS